MSLSDQIISFLEECPGQKAVQIADKLDVTTKEINKQLYGPLRPKVVQDRSYRWSLIGQEKHDKEVYKEKEKPSLDTPLKRLCKYYIECLSHDSEQGAYAFASSRYGDNDYVELNTLPNISSDDDSNPFASEEALRLINLVKRDKSRVALYLGYPTRLRSHVAKSGWKGFFVEPVFLFPFEFNTTDYHALPDLSSDLPMINFKALKALTEGGSNVLEEAIVIADELGLNNAYEDLPKSDELLQKIRYIRPEWDWIEETNPYDLSKDPPLSQQTVQGIYNRAVIISGERSPYTQGLETELKNLSDLNESNYRHTALGNWLNDMPEAEDQKHSLSAFLEAMPMNSEQREAVRNSLSNSLTVVTGPPGTGKSQIVTNLLVNAAWKGMKVLFASKNNKAVDVVEERVNGLGSRPVLLRLGSNEYQNKLADYLMQLLSATATNEDQIEYDELLEDHKALLEKFQEIDQQLTETMNARNQVDTSEKNISHYRDELGAEIFKFTKDIDYESVESNFTSFQAAFLACNKKNQNLFIRLKWPFLKKKRFHQFNELVNNIRDFSKLLSIKVPSETLNETSMPIWSNFYTELEGRIDVTKQIISYFEYLSFLQEQPSFESLAHQQVKLVDQMSDNSIRLWQQWVKLQPKRLSRDDKKLLNDYAAIIQLMVKSKKKVESKVYRQYLKLVPKVSNLLPCWAVTSLSARNKVPFEPGYFDLLVIDEASQCDIASALPLLYRAKRAVIIGDPNQLSHISSISYTKDHQLQEKYNIVESSASWMYSVNSLFKLASGLPTPVDIISLRDHHRSHANIIEFSNKNFYESRLRIATRYNNLRLVNDGKPTVRWSNIKGGVKRPSTGGAFNEVEAKTIIEEINDLVIARNYKGTIGVVSPFRAQANFIRQLVFQNEKLSNKLIQAEFLVDTVHKFQGDERDVIFFSPVVSEGIRESSLRFLKNTGNLFNVAITRARSLLHVIGDKKVALESGVDYLSKFARYSETVGADEPENIKKTDYGSDYPAVANPEKVSEWEKYFYKSLYAVGVSTIPQFNVEQYILDFAIFKDGKMLNIEIDGERYHRNWNGELCRRDQIRTQRLIELGWEVKRFWVYEVRDELDSCISWVKNWVEK